MSDRKFDQHVTTIGPENGLLRTGETDAASGTFQATAANYARRVRITCSLPIRILGGTGSSVDASEGTCILSAGQEYIFFPRASRESVGYVSLDTPTADDYVSFSYTSYRNG